MLAQLPVFVATTFMMLVVPGPDFVIITRNAAVGGRRSACFTALGICAGLLFLTLATAGGVAALVAADDGLLVALRIVGGGYLLCLGAMLAVSAWRRRSTPGGNVPQQPGSRTPLVQGFLNNVLNPKALIFYLTFIPQFLTPGGAVFTETLLLGFVVVACAAIWWTAYVTAIGLLTRTLARRSVQIGIEVVASVALGCLGAVTLLAGV
ncbi:putative threonine efflux protein [Prauserella sp. Am3]|nr:putative threonine efflux protein [Prauserella sp. Am3]